MKKILVLIILLNAYGDIFALTTQGNWRWRKNDGSQTTATWVADQNVGPLISSNADTLRLRIELWNNPGQAGGLLDGALFEDSSDAPGAHWDTINLAADDDDPFVLAGSSTFVTDLEATTQQLTAPHAANFQAGLVIVTSEALPNFNVGTGFGTEMEYTIRPTANLQPNTTYYFRVDAAYYPVDLAMPFLTTAAVLPIKLTGFNVVREGKKIRVEWSTSSEQNNDHYELQRSSDAKTWKTIASIKGNNTASSNTYKVYDERPLNGINYYVIRQFDVDGRSSQSNVKFVKMPGANSIISVYPNPSHSGIHFSIENRGASDVEAVLTNINGGIIHREIFKSIPANAINKLNIARQPAPGVYILKLKGEGLSETVRVVIE